MNKKTQKKIFLGLGEPESSRRVNWGHRDVLNLVAQVGKHWTEFCSGIRKKKIIWRDIAAELGQHDFTVTGSECDRKWRNLKIRYLAVLEKQLNGEKSAHRIDYFDKIHAFLKDDPVTLAFLEQRNTQQKRKVLIEHRTTNEEDPPDINDGEMISGMLEWSDRAVHMLLDLMLEFKDWFTDQDNDWDDATIWETISEQMKLEGHQPSTEQCLHKWASLTVEFQNNKAEAEATGSVPLWPYYTRVRHVLAQVGTPPSINKITTTGATESGSSRILKQGTKKRRGNVKKVIPSMCKQEIPDIDDDTEEQGRDDNTFTDLPKKRASSGRTITSGTLKNVFSSGDIREVCQRLENIEENMAICRRLDHLEAQLDSTAEQQQMQQQTNNLLSQVLTELSTMRRLIGSRYAPKVQGQDSTDLSSGITIVVPQSQQLH